MLEGESRVDDAFEATTAADAVKEAVTRQRTWSPWTSGFSTARATASMRPFAFCGPTLNVVAPIMAMDGGQDIAARAVGGRRARFVLKDPDLSDLMSWLRAMAGGSVLIGPDVEYSMTNGVRRRSADLPPALDQLTPGDLETLEVLAASETTKRVAQRVGVTEKTVRSQLSDVFTKLSTIGCRRRCSPQRLALQP